MGSCSNDRSRGALKIVEFESIAKLSEVCRRCEARDVGLSDDVATS